MLFEPYARVTNNAPLSESLVYRNFYVLHLSLWLSYLFWHRDRISLEVAIDVLD